MTPSIDFLDGAAITLDWLIRASWSVAVMVIVVLALQRALGDRLTPRWRYMLWWLVVIRLCLPVLPASSVSLFNVTGRVLDPSVSASSRIASLDQTSGVDGWTIRFSRGSDPIIPQSIRSPDQPQNASIGSPQPSGSFGSRELIIASLACVWALGVGIVLLRTICASNRFRRRLADAEAATSPRLLDVAAGVAARLNIRRPPMIVLSNAANGPALAGLREPRILLPSEMLDELDGPALRHVLLHEMAHVKRRDVLTNWVLTVVGAVHWFNPLARLALRRLREDRELLCDSIALAALQTGERSAYGHTLLQLVKSRAQSAPWRREPAGVVGIFTTPSLMRRRITLIASLSSKNGVLPRSRWLGPILVLAVGAVTLTDAAEKPHVNRADLPDPVTVTDGRVVGIAQPSSIETELIVYDVVDLTLDRGAEKDGETSFEASLRPHPVSIDYTVRAGDSLASIAERFLGEADEWEVIGEANPGLDPQRLSVGQRIRVPVGRDIASHDDGAVPPSQETEARIDPHKLAELMDLIVTRIEPEHWKINGGATGDMRAVEGNLVIVTTGANHARIVELLSTLREREATLLSIEAQIIRADRDLTAEIEAEPENQSVPLMQELPLLGELFAPVTMTLTDKQETDLLAEIEADERCVRIAAPRLILRSGQNGSLAVASQLTLEMPSVDEPGVSFDVEFSEGVSLTVEGVADPTREFITLSLTPVVNEIQVTAHRIEERKAEAKVDLRVADGQMLLLRMNMDHRKLIGVRPSLTGGEWDGTIEIVSEPVEEKPEDAEPAGQIYLLLKPKIVIHQER